MTELLSRSALAYLALVVFVVSTTYGGFQFSNWAGWVALGLTSGVASYFLGAEGESDNE